MTGEERVEYLVGLAMQAHEAAHPHATRATHFDFEDHVRERMKQAAMTVALNEDERVRHAVAMTVRAIMNPNCHQCGARYSARACGPTHAVVWHIVSQNSDVLRLLGEAP